MPRVNRTALVSLFAIAAAPATALAQSGSYAPPSGSGTTRPAPPPSYGSAARPRVEAELAMRGFCPVCLVADRAWVVGDPKLATVFDGKAYYFPTPQRRQQFVADPVSYAPALGGDNIVAYAETGRREPGDLSRGVTHNGRVYFVGTQAERERFNRNPARYADADLALGGRCVVCRVDLGRPTPGEPKLTTVHNGLRYQFANAQQQRRFAASPERYAKAAAEFAASNPPAPLAAPATTAPGSGTHGNGSGGR